MENKLEREILDEVDTKMADLKEAIRRLKQLYEFQKREHTRELGAMEQTTNTDERVNAAQHAAVGRFIHECCTIGVPGLRQNQRFMYKTYHEWRRTKGSPPDLPIMGTRDFYESVRCHGYSQYRSNGYVYFIGLKLNP